MSGKTARARRRAAPRLLDRDRLFADTLTEMMRDYGLDFGQAPDREVRRTIQEACDESERCWDEFILWLVHGDGQRARTLEIAAAARRINDGHR